MIPSLLHATPVERRRRLADAVAHMADAIAAGDLTPTVPELRDLVQLCDAQHLHHLAARVRRWIPAEGDAP